MTDDKEDGNEDEIMESRYKKNLKAVFHTVQPIFTFLHGFGIFILRVVNDELKPPKWKMKIYGMLLIFAYAVLFFCTLTLPTAFIKTQNLVDALDEVPGIVMLIQYITSAVTSSFLVDTTHIKIFTSIAHLDTMLRADMEPNFYKKCFSQTVKFITIVVITHVIDGIADFMSSDDNLLSTIIIYPLYLYQKVLMLSFCKAIILLKWRLQLINRYLTTFTQAQERNHITIFTIRNTKVLSEENMDIIGRPSHSNMKIRDLAAMYDLIGKICSMINKVYNYQIFMTLVSTFVIILITIWTSLYYYYWSSGNSSSSLITIVIWCVSAIQTVAAMSLACERLLVTRNESKVLVNTVIMNYDLPKTMRVQAKAFMELIEAWPLRIYVYDMFSVDITFMLKFISVATTYLIVIIQISHLV